MTTRRTFLRQSGAYAAAAALGPSVYASGAAAASEIEVGVLFSLTGGLSIIEQSLADATLMAIDEINKAGGVNGMMIKPILEDGASDPKTYNEKASKLVIKNRFQQCLVLTPLRAEKPFCPFSKNEKTCIFIQLITKVMNAVRTSCTLAQFLISSCPISYLGL